MTKVAILPVPVQGGVAYRAVAGDKRSQGATAAEALDALTAQLSDEEAGTLVVVQSRRPDQFFGAGQQQRLTRLMDEWRSARDRGEALSADDQAELEGLVEAELRASAERASAHAEKIV